LAEVFGDDLFDELELGDHFRIIGGDTGKFQPRFALSGWAFGELFLDGLGNLVLQVHALLCRRGRGLLKQGIWEFNRGYHNHTIACSGDHASFEVMGRCAQRRVIPRVSPKTEPFKCWLAKVGFELLEEIENPELAARRMWEISIPAFHAGF
jgi:hypothetical protein